MIRHRASWKRAYSALVCAWFASARDQVEAVRDGFTVGLYSAAKASPLYFPRCHSSQTRVVWLTRPRATRSVEMQQRDDVCTAELAASACNVALRSMPGCSAEPDPEVRAIVRVTNLSASADRPRGLADPSVSSFERAAGHRGAILELRDNPRAGRADAGTTHTSSESAGEEQTLLASATVVSLVR